MQDMKFLYIQNLQSLNQQKEIRHNYFSRLKILPELLKTPRPLNSRICYSLLEFLWRLGRLGCCGSWGTGCSRCLVNRTLG